ncbi:CLUMA_CG005654, isoform A [Clunio marinus]|uniref:CLUMA_CG005654, isoform A n=1 Tax=Clunio marinus TaxID=568069 RepID=A0A1J1HX59_9DIPT|nr:CLUMA_CG005654, isoform A [Clunio marinus]
MFGSARKQLLILSVIVIVSYAKGNEFPDCATSENPIACRSVSFLSKALNQVVSNPHDESLKLLPGLELVQNDNINTVNNVNDERSMPEQSNEPILLRVAKYLQTHDLKIKFSDIIGKSDLQEVVNNLFSNDDPALGEARKGGGGGKDKGGGAILMSGLMMGKMMAAMGLAGVGALAAKALGVSMMALMLAGIVALKKLTEGHGDGGHQVHYVSAGGDHHRRRRSAEYSNERSDVHDSIAPLPYRGYDMNS